VPKQNLFVVWVAEPERTLMLASAGEMLRIVQKLLSTPMDSNGTLPHIVTAGSRRCREFCSSLGKFVWPENEVGARFGTRFLEPRLFVGRVSSVLALSLEIPMPMRPSTEIDLVIDDPINMAMM